MIKKHKKKQRRRSTDRRSSNQSQKSSKVVVTDEQALKASDMSSVADQRDSTKLEKFEEVVHKESSTMIERVDKTQSGVKVPQALKEGATIEVS